VLSIYAAFGIRSFGVFGVAMCASCVTDEVRDLNGSNASLRRLRVDQRGVTKPACPNYYVLLLCQRRVPKPAGRNRCVTDEAIFRMYYVSLL